MSNLEKPGSSTRESFDENEAGIAQKKQEIAEAAAAGDYDKIATLAQEAKAMEAAKGEMIDSAHGEALETNQQVDEAKAAQEKADRIAAIAEQARLDAENSAKEAKELLGKMQGGGNDSEAETNVRIEDDPRFQELKMAYSEMNGPGSYNPEVQKRWAELSNEIASKLNKASDIKEAHFYLANADRDIVDKKWDELSRQEVENATSEEEMRSAIQNIRPWGYSETMKIRDIAVSKYPSLRGPRGY